MLNPGGRLLAIAASSLASRDDALTSALRERIAEFGGRIDALPDGSFKESGTGVNTVLVVVDRPLAVAAPVTKPTAIREPAKPKPTPKPKPMPTPTQALTIIAAKEAWSKHEAALKARGTGWKPIAGTSCFQHEEDDSLTLCTTYQRKAIGSCPPSMEGLKAAHKQLMLCQPDHEPQFFRGLTPGILEAKAEANNRVARGRSRRPAKKPRIDTLPDPLDFAAQAALLAALVPLGIVYRKDEPLVALPVA